MGTALFTIVLTSQFRHAVSLDTQATAFGATFL